MRSLTDRDRDALDGRNIDIVWHHNRYEIEGCELPRNKRVDATLDASLREVTLNPGDDVRAECLCNVAASLTAGPRNPGWRMKGAGHSINRRTPAGCATRDLRTARSTTTWYATESLQSSVFSLQLS